MIEETNVNEEFIAAMDIYRKPDKTRGPLENASDNIVFFSEYMLGVKLYSWQIQFLEEIQRMMVEPDKSKEFVAITSRQIGKSTALALFSVWACVFNKYPGTVYNNTIVGIASASDSQAKKLLYEMKKLITMGDRHMSKYMKDDKKRYGNHFFSDLLDEKAPNNTTTITFKPHSEQFGKYLLIGSESGSVIKSYPPTSIVLGETFTVVIIDEAGKTDKLTDQFFYDYMYPTGNSTDAIRIYTSTPWVSSGFFYRLVDPDDVYGFSEVHKVMYSIDAIRIENEKQYNTVMKTIRALNADGKTDEVQRAYYCRFVKGQKAYFNPEDVFNMFDSSYVEVSEYTKPCDLGIDFGGQVNSRTVLTVSALDDDNIVKRLWTKTYEVGKDDGIIEDIESIVFPSFNIKRIVPDDCPQGDFLIRKMQDKGWDVHPMKFRTEKVKKYGAFRSMLHRGEIKSYEDDNLKTEMIALENSDGRKQSVIQHAPGYSDDLIDSFVMSCFFFLLEDDRIKVFDWGDDDDRGEDIYGWENA